MKITVFTSNQPRHLSLIKDLANIADEVYAVMEVNTIFPGRKADFFKKTEVMQEYFNNVLESEKRIFGDISLLPANVRSLSVKLGDLNDIPQTVLAPLIESDIYIVFGASYIKGWLIDFLVAKGAYNIHMGVSPYYRGSSCNFWACYDKNFHLVGSTIHLLSKGLDSGPMLFHALPTPEINPFDFTMKAVKSAHTGLVRFIANGQLREFPPIVQDRTKEIRYTRNEHFDDTVAREYLDTPISGEEIALSVSNADPALYLNPFYY